MYQPLERTPSTSAQIDRIRIAKQSLVRTTDRNQVPVRRYALPIQRG
jgi:hypothetical protein